MDILDRHDRERQDIQNSRVEEIWLSLLADDSILCTENTKDFTKKLLALIKTNSKVVEYKINVQKSIVLCPNSKSSKKEFKGNSTSNNYQKQPF